MNVKKYITKWVLNYIADTWESKPLYISINGDCYDYGNPLCNHLATFDKISKEFQKDFDLVSWFISEFLSFSSGVDSPLVYHHDDSKNPYWIYKFGDKYFKSTPIGEENSYYWDGFAYEEVSEYWKLESNITISDIKKLCQNYSVSEEFQNELFKILNNGRI